MCLCSFLFSNVCVLAEAEECWFCSRAFEKRPLKAKSHGGRDLENGKNGSAEGIRDASLVTGPLWKRWESDYSRGFSKGGTRKLNEDTGAEKWVEDELSRWGQNASNGLQRGERTVEERAWRCFEQKVLERVMAAVSWIGWGSTCFMVKAQGSTGLEKVLSCIHFEGSLTGLFLYKEHKYLSNGSLETCNYYSVCTRPPSILSGKKNRKMVKSSYEISLTYFYSKYLLFVGRNRNIFHHKMKSFQVWHLFTGFGHFFLFPPSPHHLVWFLLALSFSR